MKSGAWVTGRVFSAPRVTVHVVPETLVTAMISPEYAGSASATWNWEIPVAAVPNSRDEVTVQVSWVPLAGAGMPVPPLVTTVVAWFALKSSAGVVIYSPLFLYPERRRDLWMCSRSFRNSLRCSGTPTAAPVPVSHRPSGGGMVSPARVFATRIR